MAQRYRDPTALERMEAGNCPECGKPAESHSDRVEFWQRHGCNLLPEGVAERIEQYRIDQAAKTTKAGS
jgi:hypothetical protein